MRDVKREDLSKLFLKEEWTEVLILHYMLNLFVGNATQREEKMKVDLETDEKVILLVDEVCGFKVWGERNEEGTMVIKSEMHDVYEVEGVK